MSPVSQLNPLNYVTMSIITLATGAVGFYHAYKARKIRNTNEFLVRSTKIGVAPLVMSSMATFISAAGLLGMPMEAYMNGMSFSLIVLGGILAPFAMYTYVPVFYGLKRNTIFEYLELRFCFSIRIVASALMGIYLLINGALSVYAPALAINQVTGLNLWVSIATVGIICIIYTSFGGFKAVIWTDVSQFIVMTGVLVLVVIKGTVDVGGMGVIWERLSAGNRTVIDTFTWSYNSQYTLWTMLIGNSFYKLSVLTVNQSLMQRNLSVATLKQSQLSYLSTAIVAAIAEGLRIFLGFVIFAKYYNCDPISNGTVKKLDQLTALFSLDTLSFISGLSGVFIGGLLCATLSTLSSILNSLVTLTLSDYIKPLKTNLSEGTTLMMSKILIILYGSVSIGLASSLGNFDGIMKSILIGSSTCYGPIFAVFTMGMMLPWVNNKGAIIGAVASVSIPLWAAIGNLMTSPSIAHAPLSTSGCVNYTNEHLTVQHKGRHSDFLTEFYSTSSLWYLSWSLVVGLVVSMIVSKVTGFEKLGERDPNLFFPFVRSFILKRKANVTKMELEKEASNPML